jgi:stage II sporulation protein AA (anti-sigma F factor antagonist)
LTLIEMTNEVRGDALILKPAKRIDSSNAKAFEDAANAAIDAGPKKVVIDFSGLDYISSAGLRVVLTTAKRAKSAGGGLALCGVHGNVKEVFDVSGFASVLGMHSSVEEAIASL